jgi:hypothetical protein
MFDLSTLESSLAILYSFGRHFLNASDSSEVIVDRPTNIVDQNLEGGSVGSGLPSSTGTIRTD